MLSSIALHLFFGHDLPVNSQSNNSANSRDMPVFASPVLGSRYVPLSLAFHVDYGDLNLGSHDCVVSIYQLSHLPIHYFDFLSSLKHDSSRGDH